MTHSQINVLVEMKGLVNYDLECLFQTRICIKCHVTDYLRITFFTVSILILSSTF